MRKTRCKKCVQRSGDPFAHLGLYEYCPAFARKPVDGSQDIVDVIIIFGMRSCVHQVSLQLMTGSSNDNVLTFEFHFDQFVHRVGALRRRPLRCAIADWLFGHRVKAVDAAERQQLAWIIVKIFQDVPVSHGDCFVGLRRLRSLFLGSEGNTS